MDKEEGQVWGWHGWSGPFSDACPAGQLPGLLLLSKVFQKVGDCQVFVVELLHVGCNASLQSMGVILIFRLFTVRGPSVGQSVGPTNVILAIVLLDKPSWLPLPL